MDKFEDDYNFDTDVNVKLTNKESNQLLQILHAAKQVSVDINWEDDVQKHIDILQEAIEAHELIEIVG